MKALAKTEEELFSLDIGCIRILDAFRFFTPLCLDVVAKTLGGNQRKGVYPYNWVDEKWEDKMKTTVSSTRNILFQTKTRGNIR